MRGKGAVSEVARHARVSVSFSESDAIRLIVTESHGLPLSGFNSRLQDTSCLAAGCACQDEG